MSTYLNPGNDKFESICRSLYVDKTSMIHYINSCLNTEHSLFLVSRPRRFGKSYAAAMLCAYYGYGSDSRHLFMDKEIGTISPDLPESGAYNILYIDLTQFKADALQMQKKLDQKAKSKKTPYEQLDWISFLEKEITKEIRQAYGRKGISYNFYKTLENTVLKTGRKFLWICDEWDLFFREDAADPNVSSNYLELLRSLFITSNGYTNRVFAGAYLTGILPMIKMKGESAVSSFDNYTMLEPGQLAPYVGFTASEVNTLCTAKCISFEQMAAWYDGYHFYHNTASAASDTFRPAAVGSTSDFSITTDTATSPDTNDIQTIFNPRSVIEAIRLGNFDSYWTQTASYEKLKFNIELNMKGLREMVLELLAGNPVPIEGQRFDNDIRHFKTANEVLTALVHLGYLSYDSHSRTIRIPNKELRLEFIQTLAESSHHETSRLIRMAAPLLTDTWGRNEVQVAAALELAHRTTGDPRHYNSEARLSETIRLAYYTAVDHYLTIKELPGGEGFADIVYIPKRGSDKPLMIVELKWDQPTQTAIDQIRDRHYPEELQHFGGEILLVGITYSKKKKEHICRIESLK